MYVSLADSTNCNCKIVWSCLVLAGRMVNLSNKFREGCFPTTCNTLKKKGFSWQCFYFAFASNKKLMFSIDFFKIEVCSMQLFEQDLLLTGSPWLCIRGRRKIGPLIPRRTVLHSPTYLNNLILEHSTRVGWTLTLECSLHGNIVTTALSCKSWRQSISGVVPPILVLNHLNKLSFSVLIFNSLMACCSSVPDEWCVWLKFMMTLCI